MICTTIQNLTLEQIYEALDGCEMAEIRLDRCNLDPKEIAELFTSDVPLVATCRISEVAAKEPSLQDLPQQSREIKAMQMAEKRLIRAIEAGARYVDVEIEAQKQIVTAGIAAGQFRQVDYKYVYFLINGACQYIFSTRITLREMIGEKKVGQELAREYAAFAAETVLRGIAK